METKKRAPDYAGHSGVHTPGPWHYIPSTEHHGPYVAGPWGGDICDCYAMSNPANLSVRNGGDSRPIHFQHEAADANARLIAAAPEMLAAHREIVRLHDKPLPIDQHRDPEKLWIIMQLMADASRAAIALATQVQS